MDELGISSSVLDLVDQLHKRVTLLEAKSFLGAPREKTNITQDMVIVKNIMQVCDIMKENDYTYATFQSPELANRVYNYSEKETQPRGKVSYKPNGIFFSRVVLADWNILNEDEPEGKEWEPHHMIPEWLKDCIDEMFESHASLKIGNYLVFMKQPVNINQLCTEEHSCFKQNSVPGDPAKGKPGVTNWDAIAKERPGFLALHRSDREEIAMKLLDGELIVWDYSWFKDQIFVTVPTSDLTQAMSPGQISRYVENLLKTAH